MCGHEELIHIRPKVSICIPTYKQVDYLRKTLDSVLMQNYKNYEIIITDDSPDDSVKNLIEAYDFENKLKYYKNKTSFGSPQNWNKAVEKATGEYIKMLHHDDCFTFPYSLYSYVEMLENYPDINFAFSASVAIDVVNKKTWIHSATSEQLDKLKEDPKHLFFGNFIGAPSATIYRNMKVYQYDKNLKWVVDIDFYIQFLSANKSYLFLKEPLITCVCGALHNVTNECIDNKEIEIFEYLYLFEKISCKYVFVKKKYIIFFENLFSKYNINSIKMIKKVGFKKRLPLFIILIVYNRILKIFLKSKLKKATNISVAKL